MIGSIKDKVMMGRDIKRCSAEKGLPFGAVRAYYYTYVSQPGADGTIRLGRNRYLHHERFLWE